MINAKEEFIKKLKDLHTDIKCAEILLIDENYDYKPKANLKVNYSKFDFEKFLQDLNFYYDNGYGSQQVKGIVWLCDGTWLDRDEYDGSEWWVHRSCPQIPEHLQGEVSK